VGSRGTPETSPLEAEAACLPTTDTILLDGANSVCGAPRARFPDAAPHLVLALGAVVTFGALYRRRATSAVALGLALAAVPGTMALLTRRADAPTKREATATEVRTALGALLAPGESPRAPVYLTRNDDGSYAPLFFYAHPVHRQPPDRMPRDVHPIAVHGGLFETGCIRNPLTNAIVCGEEKPK